MTRDKQVETQAESNMMAMWRKVRIKKQREELGRWFRQESAH